MESSIDELSGRKEDVVPLNLRDHPAHHQWALQAAPHDMVTRMSAFDEIVDEGEWEDFHEASPPPPTSEQDTSATTTTTTTNNNLFTDSPTPASIPPLSSSPPAQKPLAPDADNQNPFAIYEKTIRGASGIMASLVKAPEPPSSFQEDKASSEDNDWQGFEGVPAQKTPQSQPPAFNMFMASPTGPSFLSAASPTMPLTEQEHQWADFQFSSTLPLPGPSSSPKPVSPSSPPTVSKVASPPPSPSAVARRPTPPAHDPFADEDDEPYNPIAPTSTTVLGTTVPSPLPFATTSPSPVFNTPELATDNPPPDHEEDDGDEAGREDDWGDFNASPPRPPKDPVKKPISPVMQGGMAREGSFRLQKEDVNLGLTVKALSSSSLTGSSNKSPVRYRSPLRNQVVSEEEKTRIMAASEDVLLDLLKERELIEEAGQCLAHLAARSRLAQAYAEKVKLDCYC